MPELRKKLITCVRSGIVSFYLSTRCPIIPWISNSYPYGCSWHAADTAEGLPILRCASHLRSLGKVANFKNEACANGGIGFEFHMLHMLSYDHQGGGGGGWGGGVLTFLTSTSFTLRKMHALHMLSYDHQGGGSGAWGGD